MLLWEITVHNDIWCARIATAYAWLVASSAASLQMNRISYLPRQADQRSSLDLLV